MAMFASVVARRFPPTSKTLDVCSNCKDLCRYPAATTCLRGAVFLYFRSSNVITMRGSPPSQDDGMCEDTPGR